MAKVTLWFRHRSILLTLHARMVRRPLLKLGIHRRAMAVHHVLKHAPDVGVYYAAGWPGSVDLYQLAQGPACRRQARS
jgi:hypothetical protein